MSRIAATFERLQQAGQQALIPFITAGDPHPDATVALLHALVRGGADILELGVPFSDPMADGPVIQRASERALAQGMTLKKVLSSVAAFRETDQTTPVVLMGYANPIEAMGAEGFAQAASQAGVDGLLTVDAPPEEAEALSAALMAHGIDPIFLLSPTTPEKRIQAVGRLARGYVYYVSLKGVTGAQTLNVEEVKEKLAPLRQHITLPIGVGFGIRDAQTAAAVASIADAVVIGSRLVQEVEAGGTVTDISERLQTLLTEVRHAMNAAPHSTR